jgi:hypothetical protein
MVQAPSTLEGLTVVFQIGARGSSVISINIKEVLWISPKDFFIVLGNVLLSQNPAVQVPSTLEGLTVVFEMGTRGSPPPSSPNRMLLHETSICNQEMLFPEN